MVTSAVRYPSLEETIERFSLEPHQVPAVELLDRRNGVGGLWPEPRTGKTRMTYAWLWKRRVRRILVVCPTSGTFVWQTERDKINAKRRTLGYPVLLAIDGNAKDKADAVRVFEDGVVAVTYGSFWREPLWTALQQWLRAAPGHEAAVVMDEAQNIRVRTSKQSQKAAEFADMPFVRYRIPLSGTPQEQGLEDWFGIYRFMDPDILGRSWTAFSQRYVIFNPWTPFPKIDDYRDEEDLRRRVALTSYRCTEADARPYMEQAAEEPVPITLTPASMARYKRFKRDAVIEVEGVVPGGQTVDANGTIVERETGLPVRGLALAQIALTVTMRLQQLTCGFITTDKGIIDVSSEKLDWVVDRVKNARENHISTVIFCRFLRDIDRLCAAFKVPRDQGFDGSMPIRKRNQVVTEFQEGKRDLIIGQIRSLSTSIELSRGRLGIFYSFGFKSGEFRQAKKRFMGPNQQHSVELDFLTAVKTVDEKTLEKLQGKEDLAHWMLDSKQVTDFLDLTDID